MACRVVVYSFDLEDYAPPLVRFSVHCGAGTYVRSLVHDFGQILGCGAHLSGLRRLAVGIYGIDKALTLEEIEGLAGDENRERFLVPLEALLPEYPKAVVSAEGCRRLQKGRPLPDEFVLEVIPAVPGLTVAEECSPACRLFSPEGRFLALASRVEGENGFLPFLVL